MRWVTLLHQLTVHTYVRMWVCTYVHTHVRTHRRPIIELVRGQLCLLHNPVPRLQLTKCGPAGRWLCQHSWGQEGGCLYTYV